MPPDDNRIRQWASDLGRPDLFDWAKGFVAQNGRLPNSLAEAPGTSPGGGGGGGGFQSGEYVNLGVDDLKLRAAVAAALLANSI